jgi:MarR family transcriptional regulator, organic hydroperoxide resistance regulator
MTSRAEALEHLAASFRGVSTAQRRLRGRETHRPGELSFAQYSLLFRLADGEELPAGELAVSAGVSPATVTQMLDGLEAAGLVQRKRAEYDKRVVLIALTERGSSVLAARRAQLEPLWQQALERVSVADLLAAAEVLDRIRTMFEGLAVGPHPGMPEGVDLVASRSS